jgi:lysozyme family protein
LQLCATAYPIPARAPSSFYNTRENKEKTMADAKAAVDVVLRQEDSRLAGVITNEARDQGGLTRYGLCAKFHPELIAEGFYDESMDAATALPIAEQTYEADYEKPLFLDQIESQSIATALLSFSVNEGTHEAVVLLQKACVACGRQLAVDGCFGPGTLAAVNACQPSQLLNLYCLFEESYYRGIVQANPAQQVFLKGWLSRIAQDRALTDVVAVESI